MSDCVSAYSNNKIHDECVKLCNQTTDTCDITIFFINVNWLNDIIIQTNVIHMHKCDELFDEIKTQQFDAMIHTYGRNEY